MNGFFLLAIAVAYPFFYLYQRRRRPVDPIPRVAAAALVCWGLSWLLNHAYHVAPGYLSAVQWFQLGLLAIAGLYTIAKYLLWRVTLADYILAVVAVVLFAAAHLGADRHMIELGLIVTLTCLCASCAIEVKRGDIFGRAAWSVLFFAEASQAPLYAACRVLRPQLSLAYLAQHWGEAGLDKAACVRAFGPWVTGSTTLVTGAVLLWLTWRWCFPRKGV